MAFWQAENKLLVTGQTTNRTPAGRTCVDDGGSQLGGDKQYAILTTGQFSGTVALIVNAKTDTHSNECVVDKRTGLMWNRTMSASIGPTSNGQLIWDDTAANNEDIFNYCDIANLASLSGFTDWRIPNYFELLSLVNMPAGAVAINTTAFPGVTAVGVWSSTTQPNNTLNAASVGFGSGIGGVAVKTTGVNFAMLVRGGG